MALKLPKRFSRGFNGFVESTEVDPMTYIVIVQVVHVVHSSPVLAPAARPAREGKVEVTPRMSCSLSTASAIGNPSTEPSQEADVTETNMTRDHITSSSCSTLSMASTPAGGPAIASAKLQASRLTTRLAAFGFELKRTQALEAVAAVHGFSDWNTFQGSEATKRTNNGAVEDSPARAGIREVLVAPPGISKSAVLAFVFSDALKSGGGCPVWIDVTDGGSYAHLPHSIKDATTRIIVRHDSTGRLTQPIVYPTHAKALYVSFHQTEGERPDFVGTPCRALLNLAKLFSKVWFPKETPWRTPLICIDEVHRLGSLKSPEFAEALEQFHSLSHQPRMLIGAQHIADGSVLADLGYRLVVMEEPMPMDCIKDSGLTSWPVATSVDHRFTNMELLSPLDLSNDDLLVQHAARVVMARTRRKPMPAFDPSGSRRATGFQDFLEELEHRSLIVLDLRHGIDATPLFRSAWSRNAQLIHVSGTTEALAAAKTLIDESTQMGFRVVVEPNAPTDP